MILINKYTKLSSHMTSMSINDRPLIKQIMLIGSAKFLLQGVNVSNQLDVYAWAPQFGIHGRKQLWNGESPEESSKICP